MGVQSSTMWGSTTPSKCCSELCTGLCERKAREVNFLHLGRGTGDDSYTILFHLGLFAPDRACVPTTGSSTFLRTLSFIQLVVFSPHPPDALTSWMASAS